MLQLMRNQVHICIIAIDILFTGLKSLGQEYKNIEKIDKNSKLFNPRMTCGMSLLGCAQQVRSASVSSVQCRSNGSRTVMEVQL